jgi:hypothetical protein
LKGALKGSKVNWSDEIEEGIAITKVWDEFTFDEVQGVLDSWMNRLAWVFENGRERIIE